MRSILSGNAPVVNHSARTLRGKRFLRQFFTPETLLLVADPDAPELAIAVLDNLVEGGFPGQLYTYEVPDSHGHDHVESISRIQDLKGKLDLVITCLSTPRTPDLLEQLAIIGTKAAILLRDDDDTAVDHISWSNVRNRLGQIALHYGMRIIGPDCLGVAVPTVNLNATFAARPAMSGHLAYLGQSGMLGASVSSWAYQHGIGLSYLVSLGDSVDVRLSDMMDFISEGVSTQAIILHVGLIDDARHFMSALREAARGRVVLAIGGEEFTGNLADDSLKTPGIEKRGVILDAALRRGGTLRINTLDELYDSLELITRVDDAYRGPRLMLMGNGSAPAMLAADILQGKGHLAQLSEESREALIREGVLGSNRPAAPLDLGGTATPEDFTTALHILAQDENIDAILVIHAPTRMAPPDKTAEVVINAAWELNCPLITAWTGDEDSTAIQKQFSHADIASFSTAERAVRAFLRLQHYREAQELLWQVPQLSGHLTSCELRQRARNIIAEALNKGYGVLSHRKSGQILTAYGIPVFQTEYARNSQEGHDVAQRAFGALAVKVVHTEQCVPFMGRDRFHASEIPPRHSSLLNNVATPRSMYDAIERLRERVKNTFPESSIINYAIQPMQHNIRGLSVCVGITQDEVFGPVILFGRAGYGLDVMRDRQVVLPPLTSTLAQETIAQSEVIDLMKDRFGDDQAVIDASVERLSNVLITLSHICAELPDLKGLEINPLMIKRDGLVALDYAISLGEPVRQAIRPYPEGLRSVEVLGEGIFDVNRPVRAEDAHLLEQFYLKLSPISRKFRYFKFSEELTQREWAQMAAIDYDREMAFVIERHQITSPIEDVLPDTVEDGQGEITSVIRLKTDSDNLRTEFTLIVRDDYQHQGLGRVLMQRAIDYARESGILEMVGYFLNDNDIMRHLLENLNFSFEPTSENNISVARLSLNEPVDDWQRLRLTNR